MLHERFASGLVLDGALATELESRGAILNDSLWSAKILVEDPKLIQNVHLDYLRAGAEVITTASYQCSFEGLAKSGVSPKNASKLLIKSVELAQNARDIFLGDEAQIPNSELLVAASIGSYGATLADGSEYTGNFPLSAQELYDWHLPRFEILAQSGADIIAFETIPSLKETEALAKLLENHPKVLAWISFSANEKGQLGSGEEFKFAVDILSALPNLLAIGINCTAPRNVSPVLKHLDQKFPKPLLLYPNSGENWDAKQRNWKSTDPTSPFIENQLEEWWNLGVKSFGGCCRTTPDTVRIISDFVRHRR